MVAVVTTSMTLRIILSNDQNANDATGGGENSEGDVSSMSQIESQAGGN